MPVELRLVRLRRGLVRRDAARVLGFRGEGAFIRAALWPVSRGAPRAVVCLVSRDPNPTVRRAELIPTEGPSACEFWTRVSLRVATAAPPKL